MNSQNSVLIICYIVNLFDKVITAPTSSHGISSNLPPATSGGIIGYIIPQGRGLR